MLTENFDQEETCKANLFLQTVDRRRCLNHVYDVVGSR